MAQEWKSEKIERSENNGPDYILETYTDAEGLKHTVTALLPSFFTAGYVALSIVLILLGVFLLTPPAFPIIGIISLGFGVVSLFYRIWLPWKTAQTQIERLQMNYGTDKIPCTMVFWPQGVAISNKLSNEGTNLRYEEISLINQKSGYLVMKTKASKCVLIRMQDINDPSFPAYLADHCRNAKTRGMKSSVSRETLKRK